jgi:drug/metabolite transporter (DMT)-like permease
MQAGKLHAEEPLLLDFADAASREQAWSSSTYIWGTTLVLIGVVVNVASNEVLRQQESSTGEFNGPIFSIWFNHTFTGLMCMAMALTIMAFDNCTRRAAGKGTRSFSLALKEEVGLTSWVEAIRVGLWLAVLLEYNVFYATAVAVTSVSVFVALTQSCCVVVFLISINLLGEKATMGKLGAVVLCVAGVLLVSFVSNRQGDGKDTTTTICR